MRSFQRLLLTLVTRTDGDDPQVLYRRALMRSRPARRKPSVIAYVALAHLSARGGEHASRTERARLASFWSSCRADKGILSRGLRDHRRTMG